MPDPDVDEAEFLLNELSRINSDLLTSQREAHRANAELTALREQEKRLVSMVEHDLNNPLQVVLGFSQVLLDDPELSVQQRAAVERIERSAQLMRSLVGDLSVGVGEAATQQLDRRPVRFNELVESVVGRHQLLSADKGLTLGFEQDATCSGSCLVSGDVLKLERVLNNLVGNAVKYSPDGSEITVRVGLQEGDVVTSVTDQGPGISPEGQAHIFEMFHREASTADIPGAGLGLFISQRIADQHGGSISVTSTLGAGSTFTLRLPVVSEGESPDRTSG